MTKPDIEHILTQIKTTVEAVATGWQVVLAPENPKGFLIQSAKGAVFIAFRGVYLQETMSRHAIVQNGDLLIQVSIVANAIYGDKGALTLMSDLMGALTACVFDENRGEKCSISEAELVERDHEKGRWVYAIALNVPVYLSE